MRIKIALPKGRLLKRTAALLRSASWELDEYNEDVRFYHSRSQRFPHLLAKVFHEKDIPIQVAVGNYHLGICGLDWVEELLAKYPGSALVKLRQLGYGEGALYMTASPPGRPLEKIRNGGVIRIASEYPNLAESFALRNRISLFNIFPVWGGAEAYPPEGAELALIAAGAEDELYRRGVVPVGKIAGCGAFLIANRDSWEAHDLGEVVASICDRLPGDEEVSEAEFVASPKAGTARRVAKAPAGTVWLALPDGHQQKPTLELLTRAGIRIDDYPSATGNRRPEISLEGVAVKVIRPQDMPLQVANGSFDLAVTGRDWLSEHLCQFPSSPVEELLDLRQGRVRIVAVVSQELTATDAYSLRQAIAGRTQPFRVASEYVNLADKYARDNHLGPYRVVPTWGATEAFLPDDADMLIENTETGRTIARHNLKIIDTLFESTACLIGNTSTRQSPAKKKRVKAIVETLRSALEAR